MKNPHYRHILILVATFVLIPILIFAANILLYFALEPDTIALGFSPTSIIAQAELQIRIGRMIEVGPDDPRASIFVGLGQMRAFAYVPRFERYETRLWSLFTQGDLGLTNDGSSLGPILMDAFSSMIIPVLIAVGSAIILGAIIHLLLERMSKQRLVALLLAAVSTAIGLLGELAIHNIYVCLIGFALAFTLVAILRLRKERSYWTSILTTLPLLFAFTILVSFSYGLINGQGLGHLFLSGTQSQESRQVAMVASLVLTLALYSGYLGLLLALVLPRKTYGKREE